MFRSTFSTTTIGIVVDDADRKHEAEQRQRIQREAEQVHHRERANQGHRHGRERDYGRTPGLEEQHDHEHDEQQRLEQRVHDRVDRLTHEHRRVVDDLIVHALGELFREPLHRLAHAVGDPDRVAARALIDRNRGRGHVVEQRAQRVSARAELDSRDVAQARDLAVLADLHDDVPELVLVDEPALCVDQELEVRGAGRGRGAELAGRDLHVLLADLAHDVARREVKRGDLLGIEPDAHRVVAGAEHARVADAVDSRELVADVQRRVVGEVEHVVTLVRRGEVHDQREIRRRLVGRDAEPLGDLGQLRQRLRDAVLHLHLRLVEVGAQRESDGERHDAVGRRLRRRVQHVLDAVDGLLERRRDRFRDDLAVRARIRRVHDDGRRHDFRILADRQQPQRQSACDEDDRRQHGGEDRPPDEELREIHG